MNIFYLHYLHYLQSFTYDCFLIYTQQANHGTFTYTFFLNILQITLMI